MRARNNARPAVVDASVAPSTAAPPAPVAPKPDAALVDRIAELELALEARDGRVDPSNVHGKGPGDGLTVGEKDDILREPGELAELARGVIARSH